MKAEDTEHKKRCGECGQELQSWGQFHPIECCQSFKAGIKEVDRVLTNNYIFGGIVQSIHISLDDWQSKLKEWGIE